MKHVTPPTRALALTDINAVAGEPRISHRRLAGALGFTQVHKMAHLVERHIEALQRFGEVSSTVDGTGPKGGRPGKTYWLNKRQALYLCTKSETMNATEVVISMVDVFDAYLSDRPVKVRQHRRALPAPEPKSVPLHFEPGSDFLRDLYTTVMNANLRVEEGQEPNFGKALESVFADLVTKASGGKPSGKYFGDYNWDRIKGVANVNLSTARKVAPAH